MTFIGQDKIIKKKENYKFKFDVRFHLEPNIKLMKTQDNNSIFIQLDDEGWKFTCENFNINIDNGLYFGNKNSYIENQNIFISGISYNQTENIRWKLEEYNEKIKTALISVSDKTNLKQILQILKKNNIKIISSGGTFKEINRLNFKCIEVSDFTGSNEILNGRIKTLHPKIHAGILNIKIKKFTKELKIHNYENIDLVIANFYPFEKILNQTKNQKIIENIDIGGPTLVRSAAKNYNDVTVIVSNKQYPDLIRELKKNKGATSLKFREEMSKLALQKHHTTTQ